jgi:hypothetical protein
MEDYNLRRQHSRPHWYKSAKYSLTVAPLSAPGADNMTALCFAMHIARIEA